MVDPDCSKKPRVIDKLRGLHTTWFRLQSYRIMQFATGFGSG